MTTTTTETGDGGTFARNFNTPQPVFNSRWLRRTEERGREAELEWIFHFHYRTRRVLSVWQRASIKISNCRQRESAIWEQVLNFFNVRRFHNFHIFLYSTRGESSQYCVSARTFGNFMAAKTVLLASMTWLSMREKHSPSRQTLFINSTVQVFTVSEKWTALSLWNEIYNFCKDHLTFFGEKQQHKTFHFFFTRKFLLTWKFAREKLVIDYF